MCCLIKGILKCVLGFVNGLILTLGVIGMVVGGMLLWGINTIAPKLGSIVDMMKEKLPQLGVKNADETLTAVFQTIQSNTATIGSIIFVAGIILTILSILGYVVICCIGVRCVLYTLVGLLSSFTVILLIVTCVYGSNSQAKIFEQMEMKIFKLVEGYKGVNFTNPESMIVNVVQTSMHCCGVFNSTDFVQAKKWVKQIPDQTYPVSCCPTKKLKIIDPSGCIKKNNSPYKDIGCYSKVKPSIKQYIGYLFAFLGVTITVLVVLDALFIFMIIKSD